MWLWKAFVRLDRSRGSGFNGPNPITVADIEALANMLEITGSSQRCSFLDRMQLMDTAYFSEYRKSVAAKPKGKKHGPA